jgi:hypothetical protein
MVKTLILALLLVFAAADTATEDIPISPAALSGLVVVLMLGAFALVGYGALDAVSGNEEYKFSQFYVGKEK